MELLDMTPIGKLVKIALALVVSGLIVAGMAGCTRESPSAAAPAAGGEEPKMIAGGAAKGPILAMPVGTERTEVVAEAKADGPRVVEMQVTSKGYEPSPLTLKKGEPVTLRITRTTERTCATEIVIPGHDINTPLPMGQPVEVTFTPEKSGELKYGCAMDLMIAGVFVVE
jgi:plastocyanin